MPIRYGKVITDLPEYVIVQSISCPECQGHVDIRLNRRGIAAYNGGAMIQAAFPELSADIRERLISGMCGPCFDKMFPDDEEE